MGKFITLVWKLFLQFIFGFVFVLLMLILIVYIIFFQDVIRVQPFDSLGLFVFARLISIEFLSHGLSLILEQYGFHDFLSFIEIRRSRWNNVDLPEPGEYNIRGGDL